MSGVNVNKLFRRILSNKDECTLEKSPTFRKGIAERITAPAENSLERVPGQDIISFESSQS